MQGIFEYGDQYYESHLKVDIPIEYVEVMQHLKSSALYFKKQDFHLFGWELMIFKTIEITTIEPFENVHDFRLWIFIGQRSDKANYFICCDRTKAVYGKVLEFYDGHP